jgi:D-sedoheptulose 7-phosphate isomerase
MSEVKATERKIDPGLVEIYGRAPDKQAYVRGYLDYFAHILQQLDTAVIEQIIVALQAAAERGSIIYLIGNGGSAANASHMANDLAFGATRDGYPPFRVVTLADNVSIMTAIANDTDYSQIFVRQLRNLLQPQDVVFALSASGNSANVVKAIQFANEIGAVTIGCGGFDGGELSRMADLHLYVPSNRGEYGPVEDVMMVLDHLIHSYVLLSRHGTLERQE